MRPKRPGEDPQNDGLLDRVGRPPGQPTRTRPPLMGGRGGMHPFSGPRTPQSPRGGYHGPFGMPGQPVFRHPLGSSSPKRGNWPRLPVAGSPRQRFQGRQPDSRTQPRSQGGHTGRFPESRPPQFRNPEKQDDRDMGATMSPKQKGKKKKKKKILVNEVPIENDKENNTPEREYQDVKFSNKPFAFKEKKEETEIEKKFAMEAAEEATCKKIRKDDFQPSKDVIQFLAGKFLFPLSQRSEKFRWARWHCRLCDYHCEDLVKCREHYNNFRHSKLIRMREMDTTLHHLPAPTPQHLASLDLLLNKVVKENSLTQKERRDRLELANKVQMLLDQHIEGCTVQVFGSILSGFCLKSSDLNLDLKIPNSHQPHLALITVLDVLKKSPGYRNVVDEFTARVPSIKFSTDGLEVSLSMSNHHARQTSLLLADYMSLDPRVHFLGVVFRVWARTVQLDRQAEGGLSPHAFVILLVFFLQKLPIPVLPHIHDWLEDQQTDNYISPRQDIGGWSSQNQQSLAELWVELFAFLSVGLKSGQVVSVRKADLSGEEKQWNNKRLAVEDPYSTKRNLCRSITNSAMFEYMADCFKTSYIYFGTVQTCIGPIITRIITDSEEDEKSEEFGNWLTLESWLAEKGTSLTKEQAITASELVPADMVTFSFDQVVMTDGSPPSPACNVCGKDGHLASACPEEALRPLPPLPHLPGPYLRLLDAVCEASAGYWQPTEGELRDRDRLMELLQRFITRFWPRAELTLFGSSANGFAFRQSDLDISLTFQGSDTSDRMDCVALVRELADKLRSMRELANVTDITSAKVPIVKLHHKASRKEADISFYNVLARENTRMLALYARLDPRVRILGYMAKLFAKVCDIGDASKGSLSSYAHVLMMIFYLQKCSPPVIPVLQELYESTPAEQTKPENVVDGWNAWFQDDRKIVSALWPGEGANKQGVGELWVGYLEFYAGAWDDRRMVVSIKQSRALTKFEKMWNSGCIAIEDPFELVHNLGGGLSRKMNLYIKKAFVKGRTLFGTPFKQVPMGYRQIQDYFFDRSLLTDGAPPRDRVCRACGRLGHFVANCPKTKRGLGGVGGTLKKLVSEKDNSVEKKNSSDVLEKQSVSEAGVGTGGLSKVEEKRESNPESSVGSEVSGNADATEAPHKGVRKKIKDLERKKKKYGMLSKEEGKLLHQLILAEKSVSEVWAGNEELSDVGRRVDDLHQESSVDSEVSLIEDPATVSHKGVREKIKNLERRRKRNGELSKEDSKTLHELNLVDMKWKREKQASKKADNKSKISPTDCKESVDSTLSEVSQNREERLQVNRDLDEIPTTRARLVTKASVPDEERFVSGIKSVPEMFDYNSLQPHMVATGTMDYLSPAVKVKSGDSTKVEERITKVEEIIDIQSPDTKDQAVAENNSNEVEGVRLISEPSSDEMFDYNSLQPHMVAAGTIDYFAPVVKVKDGNTKADEKNVKVEGRIDIQPLDPKDPAVAELKSNEVEGIKLVSEPSDECFDGIEEEIYQKLAGMNAESKKLKKKRNVKKKVSSESKSDEKKSKKIKADSVKDKVVNKTSDFLYIDSNLVKVASTFPTLSQCRDAEKKYYALLRDSTPSQ